MMNIFNLIKFRKTGTENSIKNSINNSSNNSDQSDFASSNGVKENKMNYLSFQELAIQQYDIAFHLLTVTFPVVRDPKMLINVMNKIFDSLNNSVNAIIAYEQEDYQYGSFKDKMTLFNAKFMPKNKISPKIIQTIYSLQEIKEMHTNSISVFQRGNKYVICNRDFQLKTLSATELNDYLVQAKKMLDLVKELGQKRKIF